MRKTLKRLLRFAEALARPLGLRLFLLRDAREADYCVLDKNMWSPFQEKNENVRLYERGLEKVDGAASDSIYRRLRFYSLFQMIRPVLSRSVPGDFAECGVWKGHSAWCAAALMREHGGSRRLHIFDSFEGLSERGREDGTRFSLSPRELAEERRLFACGKEVVRENLEEFDFLDFYKGWIPSRFDDVADRAFAFVHIDVDLHQPTMDSLEFFFERLSRGGVIVVDDYGHTSFEGCTRAVREFIGKHDPALFYETPMGGAFIVK